MKPITPREILQISGAKWFHEGRELTQGEIDNLKSEADLIAKTALWKLLVNEGKYHAQRKAFVDADRVDDREAITILRQAQEFLKVVILFEEFINKIAK